MHGARLVVGLGNPGREFAGHRHNVGFMVVDRLAGAVGIPLGQSKFQGRFGQGDAGKTRLLLLEPETFMNVSGEAVAAAARFFKVAPGDLLVVHDELDLPFGKLQLKKGGGTGGHNGLESIVGAAGRDRVRPPPVRHRQAHRAECQGAGGGARAPRLLLRGTSGSPPAPRPGGGHGRAWLSLGLAEAMNRHNRR